MEPRLDQIVLRQDDMLDKLLMRFDMALIEIGDVKTKVLSGDIEIREKLSDYSNVLYGGIKELNERWIAASRAR